MEIEKLQKLIKNSRGVIEKYLNESIRNLAEDAGIDTDSIIFEAKMHQDMDMVGELTKKRVKVTLQVDTKNIFK